MNLDSRIRDAVDETVLSQRDVEAGLSHLRGERRLRAGAKAGAVLVAAAAVVAAVAIGRHQPSTPEPAPAPPLRGGAALALTVDGHVEQVAGPALGHLPDVVELAGPFEFSHDGGFLVYAVDQAVHRMDLRAGTDRVVESCPDPTCRVAFNDDLTRSARVDGQDLVITFRPSGDSTTVHTRGRVIGFSWSPTGDFLATFIEKHGQQYLYTVDAESGHTRRLSQLQSGDRYLSSPVWSPDGHQIAFVLQFSRAGRSGLIVLQTVTTLGDPLAREVRELYRCVCGGYAPGIAWSPDGIQVAVTMPRRGAAGHAPAGGAVWAVDRDGSHWHRIVSGAFSAALAWQPAVSEP